MHEEILAKFHLSVAALIEDMERYTYIDQNAPIFFEDRVGTTLDSVEHVMDFVLQRDRIPSTIQIYANRSLNDRIILTIYPAPDTYEYRDWQKTILSKYNPRTDYYQYLPFLKFAPTPPREWLVKDERRIPSMELSLQQNGKYILPAIRKAIQS
ncbi:MAG: hypothetical protein QM758_04460 [Armatimonas sp.]